MAKIKDIQCHVKNGGTKSHFDTKIEFLKSKLVYNHILAKVISKWRQYIEFPRNSQKLSFGQIIKS